MMTKSNNKVRKALFMTEEELVELYGDEVRGILKDIEPTATYIKDKKLIPMYAPDRVRRKLNG